MRPHINPYITGNPVGKKSAFVGREVLLQKVIKLLAHKSNNAMIIYGQRRIGKTSILERLVSELSNTSIYHPVYFNLENKAEMPLARVLKELVKTIAYELNVSSIDPSLDIEESFCKTWLPNILSELPDKHKLVLLFDEFDVLADPQTEQAASSLFPYLLNVINLKPSVLNFIFAIGRNVDDLSNSALALFKAADREIVSLLAEAEMKDLIRISEREESLLWDESALEKIWRLTSGHPFLTQAMSFEIWDKKHSQNFKNIPIVHEKDINEIVITKVLETNKNKLDWLWSGLPSAEKFVSSVLAQSGPDPINLEKIEELLYEKGVRIVIRELQNAPRQLEKWDILEGSDTGYRFKVELLRQWIKKEKPLDEVRKELNSLEPRAARLYQLASDDFHGGQLDTAIEFLEQALSSNPNHTDANLLLSNIYLEKKSFERARHLLESLYENQPAQARPRLVQVCLEQARLAVDENEKLNLYSRVLQISPQNKTSLNGKSQILRNRLKTLEAQFAYNDALNIALELDKDFFQVNDWSADIERLKLKKRIPGLYTNAINSLENNCPDEAEKDLEWVYQIASDYKEVRELLYLATAEANLNRKEKVMREFTEEVREPEFTLLFQAENTRNDKLKLAYYERVLKLNAYQKEAIDGKKRIWENRAKSVLSVDDLYPAELAYKIAGYSKREIQRKLIDFLLESAKTEENLNKKLDIFEDVLKLDSKHARAITARKQTLEEMGTLAVKNNNLGDARHAYQMAGYSEGEITVKLINNLLDLAHVLQDHEEKLHIYEKILELDPRERQAIKGRESTWINQGDEALEKGQTDKALFLFRKTLQNDVDARNHAVKYLYDQASRNSDNNRLIIFERILELDQEQTEAREAKNRILLERSNKFLELGNLEKAISNLVSTGLSNEEARSQIILKTLKEAEQCRSVKKRISLYERILRVEPTHKVTIQLRQNTFKKIGDIFRSQGKYQSAVEYYRVAGLVDNIQDTWEEAGDEAWKAGDFSQAISAFQKAGVREKIRKAEKYLKQEKRRKNIEKQRLKIRASIRRAIRRLPSIENETKDAITVTFGWAPLFFPILSMLIQTSRNQEGVLYAQHFTVLTILIVSWIITSFLAVIDLGIISGEQKVSGFLGSGIGLIIAINYAIFLANNLSFNLSGKLWFVTFIMLACLGSVFYATFQGQRVSGSTGIGIIVGLLGGVIAALLFGVKSAITFSSWLLIGLAVSLSLAIVSFVAMIILGGIGGILGSIPFLKDKKTIGELLLLPGILFCFLTMFFVAGPPLVMYGIFSFFSFINNAMSRSQKVKFGARILHATMFVLPILGFMLLIWLSFSNG
ncbi:MAG: tetratricopeptide repeat protein [Bdellovibrionales bacterium]|nr:tetratricopeptide repeat protein [Bdellovibrionales bacterium]